MIPFHDSTNFSDDSLHNWKVFPKTTGFQMDDEKRPASCASIIDNVHRFNAIMIEYNFNVTDFFFLSLIHSSQRK